MTVLRAMAELVFGACAMFCVYAIATAAGAGVHALGGDLFACISAAVFCALLLAVAFMRASLARRGWRSNRGGHRV